MAEAKLRYETVVAPDGRIQDLREILPGGAPRPIPPESSEGLDILAAGRDILYRFDDQRRLRDLPYPEVLEAMGQEIRLTLHKVMHGELLDEPEGAPALRHLLAEVQATAAAFRRASGTARTDP